VKHPIYERRSGAGVFRRHGGPLWTCDRP
jgi:hypothetical protein